MKFYESKHSVVGEGVEATVIYHKDNGDELLCVRSGFEAFEVQNPDAEERDVEETDKLLSKAAIKMSVPTKTEIRSDNKLSKDDIHLEIANEETPTVDIAEIEQKDAEGKEVQKLTFFEHREIKSVEDFLKAQEEQLKEPEQVQIAEEAVPEEVEPVEEPIK